MTLVPTGASFFCQEELQPSHPEEPDTEGPTTAPPLAVVRNLLK